MSPLAAALWSVNRIDVVGRGTDMAYCHKYFDGTGRKPQGTTGRTLAATSVVLPLLYLGAPIDSISSASRLIER